MRFSICDLILLPLIGIAAVPIVKTADFVGLMLLPNLTEIRSEAEDWLLNRGFSDEFVFEHLWTFTSYVPAVVVLTSLVAYLFAIRT